MVQPLHIVFNEDLISDQLGSKFSESLDAAKLNYIQVKDLELFDRLINLLPLDLKVYVWIHPNNSLKRAGHTTSTTAEAIAKALRHQRPHVTFNLISRMTSDADTDFAKSMGVEHYKPYDIWDAIKILPAQTVAEIRQSAAENTNARVALTGSKQKIDFAILTALHADEFESVQEVFNLRKHETLKLGEKNIYHGTLEAFPDKHLIAIYQSEVGRTDASTLVTEVIKEFDPRYIFMTGVCGGKKDTGFGDIVIAKFVFTFDKGKMSDEGFFRELELVKMNEDEVRKLREANSEIMADLKSRLISNKYAAEKFSQFNFQGLKSYIEPVACSSYVVNKDNYFDEVIKTVERKATAVEMESYGFARAAETTNSGTTKALIIKSIMDNTTEKTDIAKPFASFTSALYLRCALEQGIIS